MIQYHSLMNKYPAGAVTNEQSVFIQVKVTKDTPLSSLQLILKEDFTQKIHVLHLNSKRRFYSKNTCVTSKSI